MQGPDSISQPSCRSLRDHAAQLVVPLEDTGVHAQPAQRCAGGQAGEPAADHGHAPPGHFAAPTVTWSRAGSSSANEFRSATCSTVAT